MTGRHTLFAAAAALCLTAFGTSAWAAEPIPDYIKNAVEDVGRPPSMVARDHNLKPEETLVFARVKPGDKVVELYPDGYYTRILAKAVGPSGHDYGVTMLRTQNALAAVRENQSLGKVTGPLMYDRMVAIENMTEYANWTATIQWVCQFGGHVALPEQVDLVWIDHYHDTVDPIDCGVDMVQVNKSFFRALKPGGRYFVEDMVAPAGSGLQFTQILHRSDPAEVRRQIEAAGFVFAGKSNLLANPDDDHTYRTQPIPVRDFTDRYMMLFVKPKDAPNTDMRPTGGSDPMASYYGNTLVLHDGEQRNYMFEKNGLYHAFGPDPSDVPMDQVHEIELLGGMMETGKWFWDADANICIIRQYPWEMRGVVQCMKLPANPQFDQPYDQKLSDNRSVKAELLKGVVYPTSAP